MNKLKSLFERKNKNLCSVFYTSGFPQLNDGPKIIEGLSNSGVDFIEVGLPYSDPMADGPTIQNSSSIALDNGINLDIIFEQLESVKDTNSTPLVLMGYLNQMLKYGEVAFCEKCVACGIDTIIFPDLPMIEYESHYKALFEKYGITNVFLITPQTSEERIRKIDALTDSFIYVVASASITGAKGDISNAQLDYFNRIKDMQLKSNLIVGFGISDNKTFTTACEYANGAIIGSAFVKFLDANGVDKIPEFVNGIIG